VEIRLVGLFTLVVVYLCSLQFRVLNKWLNIFNSRVIHKVLNLVHECSICRHCSKDKKYIYSAINRQRIWINK